MTDLDLLPSDVEDELRASVRSLLIDRCPPSAVLPLYDGDRSLVSPLWKAIASDLGLAGLLVPEERGGSGASAREAAVVLEELGRAAAPVPFLTSSVIAATVLLAAEPGGSADGLLARLAAGDLTAALVVPLSTPPGSGAPAVTVDDGGRLNGRMSSVAGVLEADVLLVPAVDRDGTSVHAVQVGDATIAPVTSLDMTRQLADVTFENATGERVLTAPAGAAAVRRGLETGAALLASEQAGVAQWAVAGAVASSFCGDAAVRAAEEAVQLHGGIGMTWEHPAHLYLKRAKADQIALGTPGFHRARLAELVDLAADG
jgi:alkylation response protein AidB-like acyl-CoA dehydrogenase